MYLPIWGSAATCKWNLVNPLDTDAAFRLTFHGTSWDFTSGGMKPTIAYANTYFVQSSHLVSVNSVHLSVYLRENLANAGVDIGVTWSQSGRDQFSLIKSRDHNPGNGVLERASFEINNNNIGFYNGPNTDSRGFFIGTRTGVSTVKGFKNTTLLYNATRTATFLAPHPIYIGANRNDSSVNYYSTKRNSFTSMGTGLTDAEATNFYNRVNTLMTYFNINV